MARLLHDKGYNDVHPLLGGFEAWQDLGYPVEVVAASQPELTTITATLN